MHELVVCHGRGRFQTQVRPEAISDLREQPGTTVWLDLTQPSEHELAFLQEEFGFHPLAIEDATRQHERPKVDSYGDYYFVVFYCLDWKDHTGDLCCVPISLFIGQNYLVTVHTEPIKQLQETLRRWQAPNSPLDQDVGALVYALLDALVDDYFPLMDQVTERVEALEEQIFEQYDEDALRAIFRLK